MSVESASPGVYFPQTCSHITHSVNARGELRTALITGGNRLVLLKDGECVAECTIVLHTTASIITSSSSVKACVRCMTICPCADDVIRVAVATKAGLQLIEMVDTDWAGAHSTEGQHEDTAVSNKVDNASPVSTSTRTNSTAYTRSTLHSSTITYKASVPSTSNVAHWSTMHGSALQRSQQQSSSNAFGHNDTQARGLEEQRSGVCHRFIELTSAPPRSPLQDNTTTLTSDTDTIVTMAFMTRDTLCIVWPNEAILVALRRTNRGNESDVVLWRSVGQYICLSICPVHHHVALATSGRQIRVFTSHAAHNKNSNACGVLGECTATPSEESSSAATIGSPVVFSTASGTDPLSALSLARADTKNAQGTSETVTSNNNRDTSNEIPLPHRTALTASTGLYDIVKMEWQRVASHSLLCVTCRSGQADLEGCVLLYAVQRISTVAPFSNVVVHADLNEAYNITPEQHHTTTNMERNTTTSSTMQLIPCGIIPLHYGLPEMAHHAAHVMHRSRSVAESVSAHGGDAWNGAALPSVAQMHTALVPSFTTSNMGNDGCVTRGQTLQFLHVEGDGTVRTSSYQIGSRKHASFAKQRALGMVCVKLLAPLWQLYGPLTEMELLPVWLSRPVEVDTSNTSNGRVDVNESDLGTMGNCTTTNTTTHALASSRRYRLVGHFADGVRALVMVDLVAEVFRVEAFFTLGPRRVRSLCAVHSSSSSASVQSFATAHDKCVRVFDDGTLETLRLTGTRLVAALLAPCQVAVTSQPAAASASAAAASNTSYEVCERERSQSSYSAAYSSANLAGWSCCNNNSAMQTATLASARAMAVALFSEHYNASDHARRTQLLAIVPLDFAELSVDDTTTTSRDASNTTPEETTHLARETDRDYCIVDACVTREGIVLRLGKGSTPCNNTTGRSTAADASVNEAYEVVRLSCVRLDSLGALEGRLVVGGVCVPALLQAELLPTNTDSSTSHSRYEETYCDVLHDTEGQVVITVHSPLLPDDGASLSLAEYCPTATDTLLKCVHEVQCVLCVNQDVCVGVLVELAQSDLKNTSIRELWLFSYGVVQSMSSSTLRFVREHVITAVHSFCLGPRGEVMTVTEDTSKGSVCLTRWLRCFPTPNEEEEESTSVSIDGARHTRYACYYIQERSWQGLLRMSDEPSEEEGEHTSSAFMTSLLMLPCRSTATIRGPTSSLLYASSACDYLRVQHVPFQLASHTPLTNNARRDHSNDGKKVHEDGCTMQEQALLTYWQSLSLQHAPAQTTALAEQDACAGPGSSTAASVVVQYHTDVVMQLIGMGQWSVLRSLLQHVADAARALLEDVKDKGVPYHVRARRFVHRLCSASSHAVTTTNNSDVMQPAGVVEDYATRLLAPSPIALHAWPYTQDQAHATHEACAINTGAGMAEVFGHNGELLQELLRLLPHVTLVGLSRPQQLGLLCVLEALRQAADFARSVDEAAARYLLYHRLRALRRRLQLPDYRDITTTQVKASLVNTLKSKERMSAVLSVMNFAEGDVASRTTSTAHYLWAALSDSQSALLERLFSTSADETHGLTSVTGSTTPVTSTLSSTSTLTWAQVEMSGAPYWVHSTQELRTLAERVARTQYATSHSITEAALMFVLARRVSTLAALCKAQNNTKLQSFFLRNFASEEHHRRAATANAFAAVGKNMPLYAAAFFVLAGEVRSAAQVVLQRYGSPALALFVLRAGREAAPYGPEGAHTIDSATRLRVEDLEWFVTQWEANMNEGDEESNKAPSEEMSMTSPSHALTLWLRACMAWLSGQADRRVHALSQLAAHPTGLPEILGTLRYARDSVITVAHRHGEFLSCARELICVMRLGRFCLARGLYMNAELHYAEAELLLRRLQEQHSSNIFTVKGQTGNDTVRQAKGGTHAHMQADVATGTLVFHSFDSDSEDAEIEAEVSEDEEDARSTDKEIFVSSADDAVPAESVVAALRREMAHARRRIERHDTMLHSLITPTQLDWSDTLMAALDAGIFAFCSALLLSLDRQDDLRGWLTGLVTHLQPAMDTLQWHEPTTATETTEKHSTDQEEQDNEVCETHRLFVLVLQLVLGTMASRRRHYQLASALLRLQSLSVTQLMQRVEPVSGTDKAKACMHPVVAFFVALQSYMETSAPYSPAVDNASTRRSRHSDPTTAVSPGSPRSAHAMLLSAFGKPPGLDDSDGDDDNKEDSVSHAQEEPAGDSEQHRSLWETLRATTEAETRRAAQERGAIGQPTQSLSSTAVATNCRLCLDTDAAIAMLFTWFSLRVNWTVLCALYAMATTMVASAEHHEAHNMSCFDSVYGMPARLLLCQALLRVHNDFAWCTEWAMSQYAEGLTQCETCLTCDPNGLFLEADRVCRAVRASLEATLATCAKEVKGVVWQGGGKRISETSVFFPRTEDQLEATHTEGTNCEDNDDDAASPSRLLLELCIAHVDLYGQPSRQSQGVATGSTPHVLLLLRPRLLREGILRGLGTQGNTSAELLKQLIEWHDVNDVDDNTDDSERPHSPVSDNASQHAQLATMRRVMSEAALGGSSGSSVLLRSTEKLLLGRDEHNTSTTTGIKSDPRMIHTAGNASHLLYSNELLCVLERTWLRRHHTHLSLRCILLRLGLRGGLRAGPLPADRMLLHQSGHAVRSVGFDHSSGDSVVWSGEAGTMVSHGFREMLAGDHEQALQRLAPERNIATAVFSQGLAQQQQSQSYDTATTTTGTQITPHTMSDGSSLQRPRMALAISARPAPHPHLPFFLTSQRDGRVDLYPFASTECVASYVCPGLVAPVTTAAYSLDGYSFCVGLHDGSIAGWEFSAANFESSARFHFTGLFVPAGLRVVMYCGDRSSIIVAIGLVSEPHDAAHDAYTTSTSIPVTTTTYEQSVPELLVIDTVLQPGAVLVRCALPFLPDYAAYLPFLDAVLCVSAEGFIACYEVRRGQLTILGDVALDEVLASVVDEGTIVGSPTTTNTNTSANNGGVLASSLQSGGVVRATPGRVSLQLQAADSERMSGRTTTTTSSPSPHRHRHHRRHSSEAAVLVTSLAVSAYDPLIALGTSHGHALLLTMEQLVQSIASRKSWAVTMGEESYEYHVMLANNHYDKSDTGKSSKAARADKMGISVSQTAVSAFVAARQNYSILYQAAQVQVAPLVTKYAAIEDVAFSPSVLLAGLRDGKVMAVSLISQALRQLVTR